MVAAARKEKDDTIAQVRAETPCSALRVSLREAKPAPLTPSVQTASEQAFVEAEEKIAAIQADALEVAREQVRDELEEARTESATAEASIDDIRTELESMQTRYAAKLLVRAPSYRPAP